MKKLYDDVTVGEKKELCPSISSSRCGKIGRWVEQHKRRSINGGFMYLYWRIQKELNEMGNTLVFHHPNFIRAFEAWVKKNAGGLAMAEDLTWDKVCTLNSNLN